MNATGGRPTPDATMTHSRESPEQAIVYVLSDPEVREIQGRGTALVCYMFMALCSRQVNYART
jgi:hypothetical protein